MKSGKPKNFGEFYDMTQDRKVKKSNKKPKWRLVVFLSLGNYWWELTNGKYQDQTINDSTLHATWQMAYNAGMLAVREIAEGVDVETAKKEQKKRNRGK